MLSLKLKVALRGEMVMAPNPIETTEEETMVIKSSSEEVVEMIKEEEEGKSTDMFAPAWVQESTQVLKTKVGTKIVALKKVGKDDNPRNQRIRGDGDEEGEIIDGGLELAEIDQVQIFNVFLVSKIIWCRFVLVISTPN